MGTKKTQTTKKTTAKKAPAKKAPAKKTTAKKTTAKKTTAKKAPAKKTTATKAPAKKTAAKKTTAKKTTAKKAPAKKAPAKKTTAKKAPAKKTTAKKAPAKKKYPFAVGDKVVYPHHGAATIVKRERIEFDGEVQDYFVLEIATDQLTLRVPAASALERGVRPVISKNKARQVFAVFKEEPQEAGANWSRWYKLLTEKINSGDIFQVAEVVRDLTYAQQVKGISPALKRMLAKARLIIVSNSSSPSTSPKRTPSRSSIERCRRWMSQSRADLRETPAPSFGAVIVAAGRGTRYGGAKHELTIDDVSLWKRGLDAFSAAGITQCVVVGDVPGGVAGGPRRRDSVSNGLDAIGDVDWVLVHDAARPLVTPSLIDRVVVAASTTDADGVIPGLPVADTLKRVDGDRVTSTVDRSDLVAVQTPQAFRLAVLREAHAADPAIDATDDAMLVESIGGTVEVVAGDPNNIKVTYPGDLERARFIVQEGNGRE